MSSFVNYREDSSVNIEDTTTKDGVTYYKINVKVGPISWSVLHRYSDFVEIHKLVAEHGVAKDLLPPKKVIRNKTPKFVEQRREALNDYLKSVFNYMKLAMPYEFAHFLEFHVYDIFFLLQDLAKKLFLEGDNLLESKKTHKFTPLELHAISVRLKMECTNIEKQDKMYDFSHILDFCSQLHSINIEGSYEKLGSSNVVPNELQFDLVSFKSLQDLTILGVPMSCIQSVGTLRDTLTSLSVQTAEVVSMNEFLLVDIIHRDPSCIADTVKWNKLATISFSSNNIHLIDWAIRLAPSLRHLALPSNRLSELCDVSCLTQLRVLNLSLNNFAVCSKWEERVGNIVELDLSQNKVVSLVGFSRLYSLEALDVSHNLVAECEEVQHICRLPVLERLALGGNPAAGGVDYRVKVLEQFGARAGELCLDGERATERELDKAGVLQALRVMKEGTTPAFMLNSNTTHRFDHLDRS